MDSPDLIFSFLSEFFFGKMEKMKQTCPNDKVICKERDANESCRICIHLFKIKNGVRLKDVAKIFLMVYSTTLQPLLNIFQLSVSLLVLERIYSHVIEANFNKRKNTHPPVYCVKVLSVCLSVRTLTSIIHGLAEYNGLKLYQCYCLLS